MIDSIDASTFMRFDTINENNLYYVYCNYKVNGVALMCFISALIEHDK